MRMTMVNVLMVLMSLMTGAQKAAAQQQAATTAPPTFKMTSVYYDEDWIPVQYTCGVPDSSSPRRAMERRALRHDELRSDFP